MNKNRLPTPLFDTIKNIENNIEPNWDGLPSYCKQDYKNALSFLITYNGSNDTFNTYRREVERLLQWSWLIADKPITAVRRPEIEEYLKFCQTPPKKWIAVKRVPRFIDQNGERAPNELWRPFVATLPKSAVKQGLQPDIAQYNLSQSALKDIFAVLSSFYNYLIQEEQTDVNPISLIKQKSKFLRKKQGKTKIRRLSDRQWQYVIDTAESLAEENPEKHERSLFILSALYLMYLRISELAASERWTPTMNSFQVDHDGNWWFTVVGKGNKEREIAVSDTMLNSLKRWRQHLGLSPLPSLADNTPLIPKVKGKGAITSITFIRKSVQFSFDKAVDNLNKDDFTDDANALSEATVHWLRHTGISDDVKHRPREHVRDDAGHSSGAITDRYIDIERKERHKSARKKQLI